jgi:hypothetical protein
MDINEIYVEFSGNSQRYVNECCESESDGIIDGFGAGCCKRSGGVAVAHRLAAESWKMASGLQSIGASCMMVSIAAAISSRRQTRSGGSLLGVCCGDVAAVVCAAEARCGALTALLSSVPSTFPSPPSSERLFPSFGGSTRAWNAFPEALGRGARGWQCFGGISRGGVSQNA